MAQQPSRFSKIRREGFTGARLSPAVSTAADGVGVDAWGNPLDLPLPTPARRQQVIP